MKNYAELLKEWDKEYYKTTKTNKTLFELLCLRDDLIREEYFEVEDALTDYIHHANTHTMLTHEEDMRIGLLKELCDLVYVCIGTATSLGMDFDTAFRLVHANNMLKFDKPSFNEAGKTLKKNNHPKPNLADCI
jgi:predicted HAD superfamily Cof-like phosphohydrolase